MSLWLEVIIFLLGWTVLAGSGFWLFLKIRSIEQAHETVMEFIEANKKDDGG